uniref:Uncharacterized protein n=1 Tax=Rhizophora mucronata TaxID=61149 RepID=A0A2P2J6F9_RHIMU
MDAQMLNLSKSDFVAEGTDQLKMTSANLGTLDLLEHLFEQQEYQTPHLSS